MTNRKVPLQLVRSISCLELLRHTTGFGPAKIQKMVKKEVYDQLGEPNRMPPASTLASYFEYKKPLPFDSTNTRIPSYLMALEMTFPGAADIYFHPIFNLTLGPLQSKEKLTERLQILPKEWIDQAVENGETEWPEQAKLHNKKIESKRNRRKKWRPNALGWIHVNMLHLNQEVKRVLMNRQGLTPFWKRNYQEIELELLQLDTIRDIDSLAAAFALMLEAAEIGDTERLDLCKEYLNSVIPHLEEITGLKKTCPAIAKLLARHIEHAEARRYEPVWNSLARYPDSWRPYVYEYWMNSALER